MRYTIGQQEVESHANELAWKRSGFKNRKALEKAVRELPLEKKVEMLTEINLGKMCEILFEEKQEFLLSLGKKTWVDGDELYEYAKETYKDENTWRIDPLDFHSVCVMSGTHTSHINTFVMEKLTEKRGKEKQND